MDFKPCGTCNNNNTMEGVNGIPSDHCVQDAPPASPLSVTCPHLPISVSVFYGMYQPYVQYHILRDVYME